MNNDLSKVRSVVARFFQVEESAVTEEFIFPRERLQGSAARYTFHAALKRMAGIDLPAAYNANSYAELIREDESAQPMPAAQKLTRPETNIGVEKAVSERALIGIDIEQMDNMPWNGDPWSEPFYLEHFTDAEIAYCLRRPEPKLSFCGVWAAKEAAIKCCEMHPAFNPKQIEVMHDAVGRPVLSVEGWNHGAHPLALSISHASPNAVAVCVCVNNGARPASVPFIMHREDEPKIRGGARPGVVWAGLTVAALSLVISLVSRLF